MEFVRYREVNSEVIRRESVRSPRENSNKNQRIGIELTVFLSELLLLFWCSSCKLLNRIKLEKTVDLTFLSELVKNAEKCNQSTAHRRRANAKLARPRVLRKVSETTLEEVNAVRATDIDLAFASELKDHGYQRSVKKKNNEEKKETLEFF